MTEQVFVGRVACALLFAFLGACASSDSPGALTGAGGTGGSGGSTQTCTDAKPCLCKDGRMGLTHCEGNVSTCNCDACPSFVPDSRPAFSACGGEPFGRWRSKSDDPRLGKMAMYRDGAVVGQCPTEFVEQSAPFDLRLELLDGGDSVLATSGPSFTSKILDSCVAEEVGGSCKTLNSTSGELVCSTGDCGICSCKISGATTGGSGKWTRNSTTLTIGFGPMTYTVNYCVKGKDLILQDNTGLLTTMEAAHVSGSPMPCDQRSAEKCTVGAGCHNGACVGGTKCTAVKNSSDCSVNAGCSWDSNKCSGSAPSQCNLADYDVVPGCVFVSGTAKCVGTQAPCASRTDADCPLNPGCKAAGICAGNTNICGLFDNSCSACSYSGHCACDSDGLCKGTSTCKVLEKFFCDKTQGACNWVTCEGTAKKCDELSEFECASVPGCSLEILPP